MEEAMKIYNTLTDKLEEFIPHHENQITMYVCGPTVYNYVHVGNMRPVITFDMVYNYFKYLGYKVTYASNFTDVNPKIIQAAEKLKMTERQVADKFIKAYLTDLKSYNCSVIEKRPRVIDHIEDIFEFITVLINKGYAYEVDGDVYFRVSKIKDYGLLSNQNLEELQVGSRIDIDPKKENPLDFALWRKTSKGESFKSPWGMGIPGWHTECVVMINKIFKEEIDIHGGGVDLKFPHHENEIAQSKALNNHNIARYWMHNGHININGEKMSKSLGNFILAKDFIKEHSANEIKLALFKTHYRLPLNFTDELFGEAKVLNEKIANSLKQANLQIAINNLSTNLVKKDEKLEEIMNNDFNTPNLISYLMELIKQLNSELRNKSAFTDTYDKINLITKILGLKYDLKTFTDSDKILYNSWLEAKEKKDYQLADKLREELMTLDIL